jgi:hypothetical protein
MAALTLSPTESKLTAKGQKSKVAVSWPRLFLRVHAKTHDLDLSYVKTVLGIVDDEPIVENAFNEDHEDIVTFDFSNEPQLSSRDEVVRWPNRAFRNAEEWLSKRTPQQFESMRNSGLCPDLCVVNYTGLFPSAIINEILRLGLDFWLFSLG